MAFPIQRLRRLRQHEAFRRMVRETRLSASDLIYPMFVMEGKDQRREIASMPGQFRLSIDLLVKEAGEVAGLGIPAVMLFGIPDRKDDRGTSAVDPNGIVQRAITAVKDHVPGLIVVTDVCIDEYTSHGHCGIVKDGRIYVFNNAEEAERFEKTGELGKAITRPGAGPNGETVIADSERALELFFFKHGISEPVPQPPPLPFSYMGKLVEGKVTTIFLTHDDENYIARLGDTINERYRVEEIGEDQMVLTYLPLKRRQHLAYETDATPRNKSTPRTRPNNEDEDDMQRTEEQSGARKSRVQREDEEQPRDADE